MFLSSLEVKVYDTVIMSLDVINKRFLIVNSCSIAEVVLVLPLLSCPFRTVGIAFIQFVINRGLFVKVREKNGDFTLVVCSARAESREREMRNRKQWVRMVLLLDNAVVGSQMTKQRQQKRRGEGWSSSVD
ncbi:hypothetical protein IEQ34_019404 [Dendrobium chrysotoxum]|uniref:Uncharacterized protein n=1 Tax=Dendrobium chrysotoxum TaxID=161865 RepID=A0AAV7G8L2_DENCH|nr:hypothetical protein IEQ34_019404 [Dendrobium chrysotoxum]